MNTRIETPEYKKHAKLLENRKKVNVFGNKTPDSLTKEGNLTKIC